MDIRPIRTEADHKGALNEISRLMESDPDIGASDGDRLDVLATLVQAYEAKHFPIDLPDPVEAIKFRMEQAGLTPKDLSHDRQAQSRVRSPEPQAIFDASDDLETAQGAGHPC